MLFKPKSKYAVKREFHFRWKIPVLVISAIAVFLLGLFTAGPIVRLFIG